MPKLNLSDAVEKALIRDDLPAFGPGDTVKVNVRVVEGTRERIQTFQGVVIRRRGGGTRETFTVRKISFGIGVERTFPLHSPKIERLEVVARGEVRRARLYYLRGRIGRRARLRERRDFAPEELTIAASVEEAQEGPAEEEPVAEEAAAEPSADEEPVEEGEEEAE